MAGWRMHDGLQISDQTQAVWSWGRDACGGNIRPSVAK